MSRIGKKPVPIPAGVNVDVDGTVVRVSGPRGQVERSFHERVIITKRDNTLVVERQSDEDFDRALHGTVRAVLANMVQGVTAGFQKSLEIVGTGYRASKSGNKLVLTVGFSHPVEMDPPPGIEFDVPSTTLINVRGVDKELVGEVAARIRRVRPPEPYQGKGIRYVGEKVRRKAGKTGKK